LAKEGQSVKLKLLFGAFIATVLTACGGGGGGGSSSSSGGGGTTAPGNNAPSFSSSDAASVAEGATAVITIEASDEDSGDTLTYTISGDDAALFTLSDTNQLSFLAAPDFEAPGDAGADNIYNVVVTVSDGTDDVTQNLAITVTDVASPVFTTASTLNLVEGGTSALTVSGAGAITMTGGADLAKFTLSSSNGLTFNVATDFETPSDTGADNVYNVTFTATEGGETATLDLAITILDAFEGRVIDGPVSGATVFIDVDGDYVQDADELSGTTDVNGLFFVEKGDVTISASSKLISVGGTDTTTNKALPDLALVSDVPTAATASAYITPISTIIAAADTPAAKLEVLTSLGISAADLGADGSDVAAVIEAFIAKDVWADSVAGDAVAQAIQTKNVQMTEVLISAVNVADTSDAATAVSRAVAMTKSFAEGLVAQAATGQQIISTETAADGTVSFKVVETVVSSALVVAVQTYTALATITDSSLDALAADSSALAVFADDLTELITQVTDQLNFTDITDVSVVGVIAAAKDSVEDAVVTIATAVVAADATELASYGAGSASSTLAASVTAAEATVVQTVAAAVVEAATSSAEAAADLTNTGYSLPEVISVLETVE
jgi:hypothetical protein